MRKGLVWMRPGREFTYKGEMYDVVKNCDPGQHEILPLLQRQQGEKADCSVPEKPSFEKRNRKEAKDTKQSHLFFSENPVYKDYASFLFSIIHCMK